MKGVVGCGRLGSGGAVVTCWDDGCGVGEGVVEMGLSTGLGWRGGWGGLGCGGRSGGGVIGQADRWRQDGGKMGAMGAMRCNMQMWWGGLCKWMEARRDVECKCGRMRGKTQR